MVSSTYKYTISKDTKGHLPQELQPVESAVARSAGESLEEELQVEWSVNRFGAQVVEMKRYVFLMFGYHQLIEGYMISMYVYIFICIM